MRYKDEDDIQVSSKVPCISHMDSIKGSHRGVENCIKCYLWEEWKERSSNRAEYISIKFKNLLFIRLEVPQQENSYDCGLFMLHYMELFMNQAPSSFNQLTNFISKDWFYPTEASLKRARIKRLIVELAKSKSEQILSPNCNEEEGSPENEEESEVEILNSNEIFHGNSSSSDTTEPDKSHSQELSPEIGENGESVNAENEQNHGMMMVLYDPSIATSSTTKESNETKQVVEKQVAVTGNAKPNKVDSYMANLDKSLKLSWLKENNPCGRLLGSSSTSGVNNDAQVVKQHKDEQQSSSSSDDDVFETCVVEDSDSDDSGQQPTSYRGKFKSASSDQKAIGPSSSRKEIVGKCLSLQAAKRRHPVVSEAQKRLRRSSSRDSQVICLCE